jgi:hypothetical protein
MSRLRLFVSANEQLDTRGAAGTRCVETALAKSTPCDLVIGAFLLDSQGSRRGVRAVEGARLESVCWGNPTVGSNPTLSAITKKVPSSGPIYILAT